MFLKSDKKVSSENFNVFFVLQNILATEIKVAPSSRRG